MNAVVSPRLENPLGWLYLITQVLKVSSGGDLLALLTQEEASSTPARLGFQGIANYLGYFKHGVLSLPQSSGALEVQYLFESETSEVFLRVFRDTFGVKYVAILSPCELRVGSLCAGKDDEVLEEHAVAKVMATLNFPALLHQSGEVLNKIATEREKIKNGTMRYTSWTDAVLCEPLINVAEKHVSERCVTARKKLEEDVESVAKFLMSHKVHVAQAMEGSQETSAS